MRRGRDGLRQVSVELEIKGFGSVEVYSCTVRGILEQ